MSATKKNVQLHPYANVDVNSWALRIRMIREALGMSRPKFAELIGVPATTLKNYELGYREVGWPFIYALLSNEQTRQLALALFVDTPLFTVQDDLSRIGEVQYTIPPVTGCSLYSAHGMMRFIGLRITNAMHDVPLDGMYIDRWINCFTH